ncbi:glucosyltransferase [Haplosporangium sp. Z 767]|nr:glucosyltransferase [Haplosporangium sp. Z 767]
MVEGSAIAVTFRQTNVIWSLFILGTSLLELSGREERRQFDPKAAFIRSPMQIISALYGFIRMLLSRIPTVMVMVMPYLTLLAGFGAFVKWNGGIVLAFAAGMSIFAILGSVPIARLLKTPSPRSWVILLAIATVLTICVHKYEHPFLLADNRHYTFYLWKIARNHNLILVYALVPVYMVCAYFCWQALATEQTILWVIIYAIATALTLIPSPLVEFRYFITPFLIYRIAMRQSRSIWLLLEFLLYTALNAFTVWMFLTKPFRWPHEEGLQRFMW